jgi:hypothetical protein
MIEALRLSSLDPDSIWIDAVAQNLQVTPAAIEGGTDVGRDTFLSEGGIEGQG